MTNFRLVHVALPFVAFAVVSAADSSRAIKAELANINEFHLYVNITPRGKYPDPVNDAMATRLEKEITKTLSANGIKSLQYISDGERYSPCLDVHVTWDTAEAGKPLSFVHARLQVREEARIERLKGVAVSQGAITWQSDELSHVSIEEVEQEIHRIVQSRLLWLIDEIRFSSASKKPSNRRSKKVGLK